MPYSRPNSSPSFGLRTKNAVDVGEFNEYLREHDGVEQFVSISGIAIEEEKHSSTSQFTGKLFYFT